MEQNRGGDGPAVGELTSSDLTPCGPIIRAGDDAAGYRETTRAATRRVWPATCGEGDVLRLQDVVDSRRGIARNDHFLSRAKISTDDTTNDSGAPAGIRGRPVDRLLATLARPVSHRSFTEECVSEVAEAPLRVAICAIGAAVLPRCVRRSG